MQIAMVFCCLNKSREDFRYDCAPGNASFSNFWLWNNLHQISKCSSTLEETKPNIKCSATWPLNNNYKILGWRLSSQFVFFHPRNTKGGNIGISLALCHNFSSLIYRRQIFPAPAHTLLKFTVRLKITFLFFLSLQQPNNCSRISLIALLFS